MHRANEVRPILKRLGSVAEQMGCAVVLIRHLNKMQGQKSGHRGIGSVDFQAAARSVLLVGRTKEDPQLRIVVPDKSSLAPEGESIAFALDPEQGFQWKGYCAYNAEELLGGSTKQVQTKTMQAEETLRNLLDKPAPAEEILRRITAVGISERTLMTAKKNLGILFRETGGPVVMEAAKRPRVQGCNPLKGLHPCSLPRKRPVFPCEGLCARSAPGLGSLPSDAATLSPVSVPGVERPGISSRFWAICAGRYVSRIKR